MKVTLNDLTTLQDELSAVGSLNANNTAIETAIENTLSRDGTSPNAMEADFDMNSNHILNLPAAVDPTSPVRKAEFDLITSPDLPDTIFDAIDALNVPSSLTGSAGKILKVNTAEDAYVFANLSVQYYDTVADIKALSATGFDTGNLVQLEGDPDAFKVLSGSAITNGYTVTSDAAVFQNTAATLTFIRVKLYRDNNIEFSWWNQSSVLDCSTNLQSALNLAETFGSADRQCVVFVRGNYIIENAVLLPNYVTLDGAGTGYFEVTDNMSLTANVFSEKSTETSNVRQAFDIVLRNLTIDGVGRTYPEWLENPLTSAVITDPATDYTSPGVLNAGLYPGGINDVVAANRRNGAAVTTNGYLVNIRNCTRPLIENCRFLNHGSFGVGVIGCIYGEVRKNYFKNIGRISYQSPAIICSDYGSAWIITNITKANPAVITVAAGTTTLFNSATVRLRSNTWGSFPSSFTATTVSASTITSDVNSSAFSGNFLYNGRQLLTTDSYIPSLNNIVEDNFFIDLNRIAIQVGGENNVVRSNTIRNGKEGGIFLSRCIGGLITNNSIENITMSDIVANGIEANYATDCDIHNNRISRVVGNGISVIGMFRSDIDDNRIQTPALTGPSTVYPYGPFSERYDFNVGSAIIAGTTVDSYTMTPLALTSVNTMSVSGNIRNNTIVDDRIAALTDNGLFLTKSGTAGDESVESLTISGNDFSRYNPVINRANMIDWTSNVINPQTVYIYDNKRTITESPLATYPVHAAAATGTFTTSVGFPPRLLKVTAWDTNNTYPASYSMCTIAKTYEAQTNTAAKVIAQAWNGSTDRVATVNTEMIRLMDQTGATTVSVDFSAWTEKGVEYTVNTNTPGFFAIFEFYP